MEESVAIAKEADAKKSFSPTKSDKSIHHVRDEPHRQLGTLRGVIGNIRRDGGTPSADSIAAQLNSMHSTQRAPVLLGLQRMHGNRYVQRVVAGIQAKLKVGQPGDIYEQEADRVADAVMRMPEPEVRRQVEEEGEEELVQTKPPVEQITPLVQGQVEEEEEEELVQPKLAANAEYSIQRQVEEEEEKEEDLIQTKPLVDQITPLAQRQVEEEEEKILQTKRKEDTTSEVAHNLESQIQMIRGGGQPLPESDRAYFEPRFGRDFSQVRVHTDTRAADSARAVNARAFTTGRDVVFGAGMYDPGTTTGKRLLAHELTHVVQQTGGQVQRQAPQETCCAREDLEPIIWPMIQQGILRHPEPPGSEVVQAMGTSIILPGTRGERAATAQRKTIQRSIDTQPGFKPVHVRLQTSQLQWDIIQRTLTDDQVTARAQQVHRLFRARRRDYSALDAILVNETAPHVLQVYQQYETAFGQGSFQRDLSTFVSSMPGHTGQSADQVEAERAVYWDRYAACLYDAGVTEIQRAYHSARQIVYTESNVERWRREYVQTYFAVGGNGGSLDHAPLALWVSGFRWGNLRSGNERIQRLGWMPSFSPSSLRLCIQELSEQPDVHALGVRETDNYFQDIWRRYRFALDDGGGMNGYGTRNKIASYQDHYDIQRSHAQTPRRPNDLRQEIRDWYETWRAAGRNLPNTRDLQRAPNQWSPAWWELLGRWDRNERIYSNLRRRAGIG